MEIKRKIEVFRAKKKLMSQPAEAYGGRWEQLPTSNRYIGCAGLPKLISCWQANTGSLQKM